MWTTDIVYKVFAKIKVECSKKLKSKYPDIYFTKESKVLKDAQFPTVYLKRMQGAERAQDLEGTSLNGVLSTFQVEVTTNTNDEEAQEVADVVCQIMKSMGYRMLGEPFPDNTGDTHRNVSRYQREIDYTDTF